MVDRVQFMTRMFSNSPRCSLREKRRIVAPRDRQIRIGGTGPGVAVFENIPLEAARVPGDLLTPTDV